MTEKNNGGPAFPGIKIVKEKTEHGERGLLSSGEGMSLRDYFAAKAMQGMLPSIEFDMTPEGYEIVLSKFAYRIADAMLKAREVK